MSKTDLTAERLREVLAYDPETGIFRWKVSRPNGVKPGNIAGTSHKDGYRYIKVLGSNWKAHRLAWLYVYGEWPKDVIDHINGESSDNRIANLRDVDRVVNAQNQRRAHKSNKSTGLIGAAKNWGQFRAGIRIGGKMKHLGNFKTPEEAHQAYLTAKRELHQGCAI